MSEAVVSALPPPPPYYKLFSSCGEEDCEPPLQPPPTPESTYSSFGLPVSLEFEVEELLPPDKVLVKGTDVVNYRASLKKLLDALMANYRQLLDILIRCPSQFWGKVNDLERLFVNMHSLLNSSRAHQAREVVATRMRAQIEEQQKELDSLKEVMEAARSRLGEAEAQLVEAAGRVTS